MQVLECYIIISSGRQCDVNMFCWPAAPEVFLGQKYTGPEVDIWVSYVNHHITAHTLQ